MFEVLKGFKYSPNGLQVKVMEKGDIVEILSNSEALVREGYLKAVAKTVAEPKEIEASEVPKLETKPMPTAIRRRK